VLIISFDGAQELTVCPINIKLKKLLHSASAQSSADTGFESESSKFCLTIYKGFFLGKTSIPGVQFSNWQFPFKEVIASSSFYVLLQTWIQAVGSNQFGTSTQFLAQPLLQLLLPGNGFNRVYFGHCRQIRFYINRPVELKKIQQVFAN